VRVARPKHFIYIAIGILKPGRGGVRAGGPLSLHLGELVLITGP
jgi:hypothetical protein